MDERTDGALLQGWRAGDQGALAALVRRHETALLRHARALLGSEGAPEDAVQDAFLRLAEKPPRVPASAHGDPEAERALVASWLHRVTRNLCLDAMRSEKRRKRREAEAASREAVAGGLAEVEASDTRAAVERGLASLPRDQREVLVLRLLGERSYREIASITGKKIGTVGWLVSVGMKALARELSSFVEHGGSPDASGASGASGPRAVPVATTGREAGRLRERLP